MSRPLIVLAGAPAFLCGALGLLAASCGGGSGANGDGTFLFSCQNVQTSIETTCDEYYSGAAASTSVTATWTAVCQGENGTISQAHCPTAGSLGGCKVTATGSATYGVWTIEVAYAPDSSEAAWMSACASTGGQFIAPGAPPDAGG